MSRRVVLVCGGRDFPDWRVVDRALSALHESQPISMIVEGGAAGADCMAWNWAQRNSVPRSSFPADWGKYGQRAGPIRNAQMLREAKPDLVVAFSGGKGTAHMVSIARKAGIEVREIPSHPYVSAHCEKCDHPGLEELCQQCKDAYAAFTSEKPVSLSRESES